MTSRTLPPPLNSVFARHNAMAKKQGRLLSVPAKTSGFSGKATDGFILKQGTNGLSDAFKGTSSRPVSTTRAGVAKFGGKGGWDAYERALHGGKPRQGEPETPSSWPSSDDDDDRRSPAPKGSTERFNQLTNYGYGRFASPPPSRSQGRDGGGGSTLPSPGEVAKDAADVYRAVTTTSAQKRADQTKNEWKRVKDSDASREDKAAAYRAKQEAKVDAERANKTKSYVTAPARLGAFGVTHTMIQDGDTANAAGTVAGAVVGPVGVAVANVSEAVRTPKSKQPAQKQEIEERVTRKMAERDAIEVAKKEGKIPPVKTKKKKKSSGSSSICVIS
jgi:hypothetical protein